MMTEAESPSPIDRKMPWMDGAIENLCAYLKTPEGETWLRDFESIIKRIKTRSEFEAVPEIPLTLSEEAALAFIQSELNEGRSPGVRMIARAAGLKSSR